MKTYIQGSQTPGGIDGPGIVSLEDDGSVTTTGAIQVYDDGTSTGVQFNNAAGDAIGTLTDADDTAELGIFNSTGTAITLIRAQYIPTSSDPYSSIGAFSGGRLLADFSEGFSFAQISLLTPVAGMVAMINDSDTATWGANITTTGAFKVLAFYNGTNWTVIGK